MNPRARHHPVYGDYPPSCAISRYTMRAVTVGGVEWTIKARLGQRVVVLYRKVIRTSPWKMTVTFSYTRVIFVIC